MFGFVSEKKYKKLEAQYKEVKETKRAEWHAGLIDAEARAILKEKVNDLLKDKQSMQEEIAHWKQMYADEVQKRTEMAKLLNNQ